MKISTQISIYLLSTILYLEGCATIQNNKLSGDNSIDKIIRTEQSPNEKLMSQFNEHIIKKSAFTDSLQIYTRDSAFKYIFFPVIDADTMLTGVVNLYEITSADGKTINIENQSPAFKFIYVDYNNNSNQMHPKKIKLIDPNIGTQRIPNLVQMLNGYTYEFIDPRKAIQMILDGK